MKIKDVPKLGKVFFLRLIGGQKRGLISKIIERFQADSRNYKGEPFANYSKSYAKAKSSGDKVALGIQGPSQASKSTTPDMTLTGKLFRGLLPQEADDYSATFGWTGPNAEKVEQLHGHKNYQIIGLSGDAVLAEDEEKYIEDKMLEEIDKNIKEYCKDSININLGK